MIDLKLQIFETRVGATMPYINDEGGKLNNFAREPKMYQEEPMSETQQRNYLFVGVFGLVLVGGLMVVAMMVS